MIERLLIVAGGVGLWLLIFLVLQRDSRIRIDRMKAVARSRTNTGGRMDPRNEQQKQGDPGSVTRQQGSNVGRRPGTPGSDREYAEVNQRFTPRVLLGDQKQQFNELMFSTKDLAEKVIGIIPNIPERAIALDKLEEFSHWCESGLQHGVTSGITG